MNQQFTIDDNFPGGNILLEEVQGNHIFLRQDLRDTAGDWFYWAFRVSGAAGQKLNFHFTGGDVLGVRGPAVSYDEGATWQWLGDEVVSRDIQGTAFSHNFLPQHTKVLFAFCPLYVQDDLDRFLARWNSPLQREVLCHSRAGRNVELLRMGNNSVAFRLLLTCRHHACEAMASYCLEGIMEAALAENELGAWLRENVQIAVVPFMDKDGVEAGDQGKNRQPHDHNRDYGGAIADSIYPEVKALRQWAPAWLEQGESSILLDLHCPWIRGERNEEVYFVGVPEEQIWQRVMEFSAILETSRKGVIPFKQSNNLPYGVGWNTQANYGSGRSCTKWANEIADIHFAVGLEVPYANAGGEEVTPQSCRALGHDLMLALRLYLMK